MDTTIDTAALIPILYKCIVIFGIAGLVVPLFNRWHISPVLGFLVCGVIISPYTVEIAGSLFPALEAIPTMDQKTVSLLGKLGILGLLFMIGLELSYEKLSELKRFIFGLGSMQIFITGVIIIAIAYFFNNSVQASIVIGAGFALSSTAIVMQLLRDYNLNREAVGQMGFSILLMQDLAVIPILVMINAFAGDADNASQTPLLIIYSIAIAAVSVAAIYFIGRRVLQPILHKLIGTHKDEWIAAFTLFLLCAISVFLEKIGLSMALGAFLTGLLIAETEFREKVERIMMPLKSILLGIFFISIGMMVDISEIIRTPVLLALSVIGIFMLKGAIIYPLSRMFGIKHAYARDISIMLCQPGEFTLMIISVSLAAGLLPREDAQFFLLVTVLGMIVTPFVFKAIPSVRNQKFESHVK
jgi:CPA2 family monovalent cation:H+ antiporter-2